MPDIDLDPHEWRLKGAKRIKPFKKQPDMPLGRDAYRNPIFSVLAVIFGIWAACVIAVAHMSPGNDPWIVAAIALGPVGIMLLIMVLFDE